MFGEKQFVVFREVEEVKVITEEGEEVVRCNMRRGHSFIEDTQKITDIPGEDFRVRYVLWEEGGGSSNTGYSQIVCGCDGSPLKPLFVRRRGHLACGAHAAFAVWEGQQICVIKASHWREEFRVWIYELTATREALEVKTLWEANELPREIENELPEKLKRFRDAVVAAADKACCYHCREPHYTLVE